MTNKVDIPLGEPLKKSFNLFKENIALFVISSLIYLVVVAFVSILSGTVILLPLLLLIGPMMYGIFYVSTNVLRGKETIYTDVFKGMKDGMLGKNIWAMFLYCLFTFLWWLLLFIPGIIALLRYSFTFLILRDNPQMSANEARKKSCELTKGHKGKILVYGIVAAIGMYLFGIGALVTMPIGFTAIADLYERVK